MIAILALVVALLIVSAIFGLSPLIGGGIIFATMFIVGPFLPES